MLEMMFGKIPLHKKMFEAKVKGFNKIKVMLHSFNIRCDLRK